MDAGQIAQRFPLVARPRPTCPPLTERVREINDLAHSAESDGNLAHGAAALNKAALIASDCGLPDLARSLCWRHHEVYLRAQPLGAQAARYALEPLVNLARLQIRQHDGNAAHHLLETLFHAVKTRSDSVIDGRLLSFRHLTESETDHREVCQWLWAVLLADGLRALVAAGRWNEAVAHAEQHHGIGRQLLDGRQIAILARCLDRATDSALALLQESETAQPWQEPVASCLTVLSLVSGDRPAEPAIATMVDGYLRLEPQPELAVFRTRLGLTAIDLAGGPEQREATPAVARLVREAVAARDGYGAREVLGHDGCRALLTDAEERALSAALQSSGLDRGEMPAASMADLLAATEASEKATTRSLMDFRHREGT